MPSTYTLSGFLYNNAGVAISGATANTFKRNDTASALSTATTDTSGFWQLPGGSSQGEMDLDVQLTNSVTGAVRRVKFDDKTVQETVITRNLNLSPDSNSANSSDGFFTKLRGTQRQGSSHTITFPALTGAGVVATSQSSVGALVFGNDINISSGTLSLNGAAAISSARAATFESVESTSLTISGTSSLASLHVTGGSTFGGTITSSDINAVSISASDSVAITGGGFAIDDDFVTDSNGLVTISSSGGISNAGTSSLASLEVTGGSTLASVGVTGAASAATLSISGNSTLAGTLTVGGLTTINDTLLVSGRKIQLTAESTSAPADMALVQDGIPTDGNTVTRMLFSGGDSADSEKLYASISTVAEKTESGNAAGRMVLNVMSNDAALTEGLTLAGDTAGGIKMGVLGATAVVQAANSTTNDNLRTALVNFGIMAP